jgi:hypothetical protein
MKSKDPESKPEPRADERSQPRREGALKHILDTGLPPGIDVPDAKDPGSQVGGTPADDRS